MATSMTTGSASSVMTPHLLSASGDKVVLWDLGQRDRISRATRIPIEPSCNACSGPRVAVSPDGRRVAVVDGSGTSVVIHRLAVGAASPQKVSAADLAYLFAPPIWEASGQHVVVPVAALAGGSNVPTPAGLPAVVRFWPAGEGNDEVVAAG